ncbi:uncharacterized protein LOC119433238 [Dermacentor silvarum]|uniref:uncharacterized protein LOC119433238 n=1 Tax=Dermacentor silvarum TaxID=543639 RepID=UPI0021014FC6|nr:uncharacterized protein LOC119433238 [Dermacentor silvarum]
MTMLAFRASSPGPAGEESQWPTVLARPASVHSDPQGKHLSKESRPVDDQGPGGPVSEGAPLSALKHLDHVLHSFAGLEHHLLGQVVLRHKVDYGVQEEAIIVAVTCPFDNRPAGLNAARQVKKEKYQPAREYLLRKFQKVSVATIVVGAIGSWEPSNDRVMHRFCSRKYLRLLKNLAVSETIAACRVLAMSTQCTLPPSE